MPSLIRIGPAPASVVNTAAAFVIPPSHKLMCPPPAGVANTRLPGHDICPSLVPAVPPTLRTIHVPDVDRTLATRCVPDEKLTSVPAPEDPSTTLPATRAREVEALVYTACACTSHSPLAFPLA